MEKLKNVRLRVFITAAAILLASAAVFIISMQIAMGAEDNKVVEQPSGVSETPQPSAAAAADGPHTNAVSPAKAEAPAQPVAETNADSIAPSATPKPGVAPEPISEDEAVKACTWVANELYGLDVDKSKLIINYEPKEDVKDENGNYVYTTHENWLIRNSDFFCSIDAASGIVATFELEGNDYPGVSITEGEFSSNSTGIVKDYIVDLHNSPDDIYVKAAYDLVSNHLANGRNIENIMIDGIQFVWKKDSNDCNPDAEGTILVDCHVYMEAGESYTLSFWGIGEVALNRFYSHPTQHACMWGYFYEEEAADYPPEGNSAGAWQNAPGVTGEYSDNASATPRPTSAPSN
jgi:hypothetical protein